jgi:hypothetical protein
VHCARPLLLVTLHVTLCFIAGLRTSHIPQGAEQPATRQSDDAPLPDYISGDECLFCHRFETAQNWQENRHNRTIRRVDADERALFTLRRYQGASIADGIEFVMGGKYRIRFLKKGQAYGQLDLLTTELIPEKPHEPAKLIRSENPEWDMAKFGSGCAGCHATQANSRTQSFAAVSLDCYVCHGDTSLEHTKDKSRMLFARGHQEPPRVIVSSCGQCHLRGGRSRTTRLPYPKNYIAGGDLFTDFQVNFAAADDPKLNPGDRHVFHNARTVMELGMGEVTCLSCHSVHTQSTLKHRRLLRSEICFVCHDREASGWTKPSYEVHSSVCGY